MRFDPKIAGLLLIAAGVLTGGVYVLDAKRDKPEGSTHATPDAAPAPAPSPASHPRLPASHPPVAESSPPAGANAREGKVQVDPARAFTHFRVGNNSVGAIYADGSVMWVGTSGGVVRYDTATHEFKTYDASNGLLSNGVFHLGKLRGKIAVGTYGGGLSLLDQKAQKWEHYSIPEGLGDAFVYDVLEASNGDVWIATGSGANRVHGGALRERAKWQLYTVANSGGGLPSDRVYALAQGKDGSLWFATEGGLARFRQGKWANWARGKGLGAQHGGAGSEGASEGASQHVKPSPEARPAGTGAATTPDQVAALEVDKDGRVWAGTRGAGLARFDGAAWKNYTTADGLPSNHVSALHLDGNGQLWIGTDKGLAVLRDGKFRVMTTADGLLAASVRSVTTAADGGIWVGSFGGVAHIRPPVSN